MLAYGDKELIDSFTKFTNISISMHEYLDTLNMGNTDNIFEDANKSYNRLYLSLKTIPHPDIFLSYAIKKIDELKAKAF